MADPWAILDQPQASDDPWSVLDFTPDEIAVVERKSEIAKALEAKIKSNPFSVLDDSTARPGDRLMAAREAIKLRKESGKSVDPLYFPKKLPVVGSAFSARESMDANTAGKLIEGGVATAQEYYDYARYLQSLEDKGDFSTAQRLGDGILSTGSFIGDMLASGGIGTMAGQGAKRLAMRGLVAAGGEAAAKSTAGRLATAGAKVSAATLGQAAAMPSRVAESAAERNLDIILPGDDGKIVTVSKGKSLARSVVEGYLDVVREVGTEKAGEGIVRGLGAFKSILPASMQKTLNGLAKMPRAKALEQIAGRAGIQSLPIEMLEERLGEIVGGATGLDSNYGTTGKLLTDPMGQGAQALGEEAAVLGATVGGPRIAAGGLAAGRFLEAVGDRKAQREYVNKNLGTPEFAKAFAENNPEAAQTLAAIDSPSRSQIEQALPGYGNPQSRKEFADNLRKMAAGGIRQDKGRLRDMANAPPPQDTSIPVEGATVPQFPTTQLSNEWTQIDTSQPLPQSGVEVYRDRHGQTFVRAAGSQDGNGQESVGNRSGIGSDRLAALEAMSIGELNQEASRYGIKRGPKKSKMIERIMAAEAQVAPQISSPPPKPSVNQQIPKSPEGAALPAQPVGNVPTAGATTTPAPAQINAEAPVTPQIASVEQPAQPLPPDLARLGDDELGGWVKEFGGEKVPRNPPKTYRARLDKAANRILDAIPPLRDALSGQPQQQRPAARRSQQPDVPPAPSPSMETPDAVQQEEKGRQEGLLTPAAQENPATPAPREERTSVRGAGEDVKARAKQSVAAAFPGSSISDIAPGKDHQGGYRIEFPNGQFVEALIVPEIKGRREQMARSLFGVLGREPTEDEIRQATASGAYRFRDADGNQLPSYGAILLANGHFDHLTGKHEAFHMVRRVGLITPEEFAALERRHAPGLRQRLQTEGLDPKQIENRVEEALATSRETWAEPSFAEKVKAFFASLLKALGVTYDARMIEVLMQTPEFWSRNPTTQQEPNTDSREKWQIPRDEYIDRAAKRVSGQSVGKTSKLAKTVHAIAVREAVNSGKPVPPEVLRDYPNLTQPDVQFTSDVPQAAPASQSSSESKDDPRDKVFEQMTKLKGSQDKGGGIFYFPESVLTAERRKRLMTDRERERITGRIESTFNFEFKDWADVTGNPSDRGYAILDRRARNRERSQPTAQTPPAAINPTPVNEVQTDKLVLRNEKPRKTAPKEVQPTEKQDKMFSGMDLLPGQQDLFKGMDQRGKVEGEDYPPGWTWPEYKKQLEQMRDLMNREADSWNTALHDVLGGADPHARAMQMRKVRNNRDRGNDAEAMKNFDVTLDRARKDYPQLLTGRYDDETNFIDNISKGFRERVTVNSPEVQKEAWKLAEASNTKTAPEGDSYEIPDDPVFGGGGEMAPNSDVPFQVAYHGSPHKFDRFTTQKMGTGEGAQVYGWGLYFADKKEVAEHYRKLRGTEGVGYQVDMKPSENEYLVWDETLNNQSPVVKDAMLGLADKLKNTTLANSIRNAVNGDFEWDAGDFYNGAWRTGIAPSDYLDGVTKGDENLSKMLLESGVRGIKFLDGGSRVTRGMGGVWHVIGSSKYYPTKAEAIAAGDGSYNYVIFDDADVEIQGNFQVRSRANIGETGPVRRFTQEQDPTYNPENRPDEVPNAEASRRLKENGYEAERARLMRVAETGGDMNDTDVIVARRVFNAEAQEALKSGDTNAILGAQKVLEAYRRTGTEQGRAFRQRRDWQETPVDERRRMLAEAVLTPPTKTKEAIDNAMKEGNGAEAERLRRKWADEYKVLKKQLMLLGVDLDNLNAYGYDPVKAARALGTVRAAKADMWDKAYEYWRNAILSGTGTQVTNALGTAIHGGWKFLVERPLESVVNLAMRRPEGAQIGEFRHVAAGILPGLQRAARNAMTAWNTELPELERQLSKEAEWRIEEPNVAIKGNLGRWVRGGFIVIGGQRGMLAADDFMKSFFATLDVGAQAYRAAKAQGLTGDKMREFVAREVNDLKSTSWAKAHDTSLEVAFQQKGTKASRAAKRALLDLRRDVEVLGIKPLAFIFPFVTTPVNILETGLRKSPVTGDFAAMKRMWDNWRAGRSILTDMTPRLAERIVAWGTVLALSSLVGGDGDEPFITGTVDSKDRGQRDLSRRTFHPQSINIGGRWYSYSRVEPFATALALTVDWVNAGAKAKQTGDYTSIATTPFTSLFAQMKDKTFLDGVGDVMRIIEAPDPVEEMANWSSNFAVSWVPNIVRSTLRATSDTFPERGVWGEGSDKALRLGKRMLQRTELGIVKDQPAIDLWGREAKRGTSPIPHTDFLWRIMSPSESRIPELFIGDRAILNWNAKHPGEELLPSMPQRSIKVDGKQVALTDEQLTDYLKLSGTIAKGMVERLNIDPENPTEQTIDEIKSAIETARSRARDTLKMEWKGGPRMAPEAIITAEFNRDVNAKADVLTRLPPKRLLERRKWLAERAEALDWLKAKGVSKDAVIASYVPELKSIKTPKTRFQKRARLLRSLSSL